MLGPSWGYLWGSWALLGSTLGYLGAILWPLGASSSTYSSNIENTYPIEMLKSLSLDTCQARVQRSKAPLSSDIAFALFIGILRSLSLDLCRVKTHQTLNPTRCHRASNLHTSLKCRNRSCATPVQSKTRSSNSKLQQGQSGSAATEGKSAAKPSLV